MQMMRLGRTEILASRTALGALPIQRREEKDAVRILRTAYERGINFFDTARYYSNSEERLGKALSDVRSQVFIATKTGASDRKGVLAELETSLRNLKTDYVDIYQLHNPASVDYEDPESAFAGLLEARQKGYVRFLGLTNHRYLVAMDGAKSGKFDTIQFPFSLLATEKEKTLVQLCKDNDLGFIAMKALSGGLIRRPDAAFAFLRQYPHVLPIWGIQFSRELEEVLSYEANPPELDEEMRRIVEEEKSVLSGDFCRGCGYCQPCPAEIPIEMAARIELFMTRSPYVELLSHEFAEKMERIDDCIHCNHCKDHCPYGLDTPELLKKNLAWYRAFRNDHYWEIPDTK